MMASQNFKDLSGQRFGRWTVINRGPNSKRLVRFYCLCDCGKECLILSHSLCSGSSKGCLDCHHKDSITHGASKTKTYGVYRQMIERCYNQSHIGYRYYGERGITVSDRWKESFKNFLEDMGEKPEGLSIDRINNDSGYSKENCRWTTMKEQRKNQRPPTKIWRY